MFNSYYDKSQFTDKKTHEIHITDKKTHEI